jgi:hypothetical protein
VAVSDLRARFDAVPTQDGTPAHEVKVILMEAAVQISDVVDDDTITADVAQHLEKALHRAVSRLTEEQETGDAQSQGQDEGSREGAGAGT